MSQTIYLNTLSVQLSTLDWVLIAIINFALQNIFGKDGHPLRQIYQRLSLPKARGGRALPVRRRKDEKGDTLWGIWEGWQCEQGTAGWERKGGMEVEERNMRTRHIVLWNLLSLLLICHCSGSVPGETEGDGAVGERWRVSGSDAGFEDGGMGRCRERTLWCEAWLLGISGEILVSFQRQTLIMKC